jgi:Tfp pilus assembly protein PilV
LRFAGEAGDTLIEVLVSAVVIVLVVVATITALNNANHATAQDRIRSQADALAQQDEDELRSEPINKLSEQSKAHEAYAQEVTKGGTHYTITSRAEYVSDTTGTSSCTSASARADYIATSSSVTWSSIGKSKPVIETGVVSPPADAAVIVQVTGASGEPVSNMLVEANGPTTTTTETSTDGCAILAVLPGEYTVDVSRPLYVDQNGYEKSDEDPVSNSSFYVVAEATVKRSYEFALAGELGVKFYTQTAAASPHVEAEGDSFVIFNSGLTAFRSFPSSKPTVFAKEIKSPKTIFPFTTPYIVYAGTCEADMPTRNGQVSNPGEATVLPLALTHTEVPLAPIELVVEEGSGKPMVATVVLTDTGCATERTFTTTSAGKLPHPGLPFGTYSLCASGNVGGVSEKDVVPVANDNAYGTPVDINLATSGAPGSCP